MNVIKRNHGQRGEKNEINARGTKKTNDVRAIQNGKKILGEAKTKER